MGSSRANSVRPAPETIARDVLENLLEGCQVIGLDWTYLYLNETAVQQARRGKADLLGRTMMESYPGIEETPLFDALRRCMSERTYHRMENEFAFDDGTKRVFDLRMVPIPEGLCVLSMDITDRKRAEAALARSEAQLHHAQKMEAVGRLAGGVAHDFNNVLSVILSYANLMLDELPGGEPLRADVEEVRTAALRGAGMTRQLLTFSRQQVVEPRLLDANQLLAGMEKMVVRLLGADVELTILPGSSLRNVRADAGQLEQVVMNLVVNARDAMPRGGKLTIQTNDVDLDEAYARDHLGVVAGPYVMIAVSDTGVGMDQATQAHIFEPYFTTKEKGRGTGLGLPLVFGIVSRFGGHVTVYSEPGRGSTFKVFLPEARDTGEVALPGPPAPQSGRGAETILLVENDDQVRHVVRDILRRNGYTVLETPGAGDALLASEQHGAKIDLLLTDVVLPRMSGPELAERLRGTRPAMKVLFMSGYTEEAILQHGLLDSGVAYLQKPITPDSLLRKVRQVVATARA